MRDDRDIHKGDPQALYLAQELFYWDVAKLRISHVVLTVRERQSNRTIR